MPRLARLSRSHSALTSYVGAALTVLTSYPAPQVEFAIEHSSGTTAPPRRALSRSIPLIATSVIRGPCGVRGRSRRCCSRAKSHCAQTYASGPGSSCRLSSNVPLKRLASVPTSACAAAPRHTFAHVLVCLTSGDAAYTLAAQAVQAQATQGQVAQAPTGGAGDKQSNSLRLPSRTL